MTKPDWLKVKIPGGENYNKVKRLLSRCKLHTVCEEAKCPNLAECFGRKIATFMVLGDTCTRNCHYCNVKAGELKPLDSDEPKNVALSVKELGLSYVVITSVTRDDLDDGGAEHFAKTIEEIKKLNPNCKVEVLIPDFKGNIENLKTVIAAQPFVLNHNIEVVKSLFSKARPQGNYELSLQLLKNAKEFGALTKSGLMIGLGETKEEIISTLKDLRNNNCDYLTIGQYLQPTKEHLPVERYYSPEEFDELKQIALELAFKHVESGPLVRSSYHADSIVV